MKPPLHRATVAEPVDIADMTDECSAKTYRCQMLHKLGHGMADMQQTSLFLFTGSKRCEMVN